MKMTDENLKQTMQKQWQKVRASFYYPQLPNPNLREDIPDGQFNFQNLQISVSPKYLEELAEKGVDENTSLNAILGHETGHFIDYPGSVLNLLRLHKIARENLDEEKAFGLRESFLNVQNNTNLVQNKGYESIPVTSKPEAVKAQGLDKIFFGLYQELWNKDLGVKLDRKEKKLVKELQKIDYLNKNNQEQNFREFINIIKDYQTQEQSNQKGKKEQRGRGNSNGNQNREQEQGQNQVSSLDAFSENQIKEGIRQFAQESKPGEFEQIVKEVLKETEKGYEKQEQVKQGSGAGTERGNLIIARNFYSALAENFSIPIRHKKIHKNGTLYPHSHEEFNIDDNLNDLDAFSSPGVIPGITKKWIRKEGESVEDYFGVPDSLVVIDSSGSMPNPDSGISIPVLGATVITNAYLNNNAKASVYNFSADNIVVGPSKNKERLHKTLRTYQGGGTVFNTGTIEDIVRKQGHIDISIVSDMELSNLGDFLAYTSSLPNVHRVHLFYTNSGNIHSIADELKNKENIAILPLHSQEDIRSIVIGELKKSIK